LIPAGYWLSTMVITYIAVLIAVPTKFINRKLFVVFLSLPAAFFSMFKLLFNLRGANKTFIHTPHGAR